MKRKLQTFVVQFRRELAALCAGIASVIILSLVRPHPEAIVIATAHDLPAGHTISEKDVSRLAISQSWPSAIRSIDEIVGQTLTHSVQEKTPLNVTDFLNTTMTKNLAREMRAVSIDIAVADASLAQLGACIDVFGADGQHISYRSRVIGINSADAKSLALSSRSSVSIVVSMTITEVSQLASARTSGALTIAASSN